MLFPDRHVLLKDTFGLGQMRVYDSLLLWRQAMAQRYWFLLFISWEMKLPCIFVNKKLTY